MYSGRKSELSKFETKISMDGGRGERIQGEGGEGISEALGDCVLSSTRFTRAKFAEKYSSV